ncbi:MAG: PAS domain S-box protein [Microcoleaceae cyanobacterium]
MSKIPNSQSQEFQKPISEVERLRECLDASEANHHRMMETMPQIVWVANPQGEITYLNQRWQDYTGLNTRDSLGQNCFQAVHPGDRQTVQLAWQKAVNSKQPYEMYCRLRQADRSYHRFIARAEPVRGENKEISQWIGTYTKLGKHEQRETELEKEQQFLEALLNNVSDAIVACDVNGTLKIFNRASEEFHGLPLQPISPEEWAEHYQLYQPDGKTLMSKEELPLYRTLKGELVRNLEMVIISKQGIPRTVEINGNIISSPDGKTQGVVVTRDITQRKLLEAASRESEVRYRAIFNQTFQFIGVMEVDGVVLEINQTALDFSGLTAEEVIGKPLWEAKCWHISPETPTQLREAVATAAGGEFVRYEVKLQGKENQVSIVDFSLKPIFDEQQKVVLIICEGRDITQSRQTEDELKKSEERWQLAIQGSGDGIFDWNIVTGEAFMSVRFKEMLGYTDQEISNYYESWSALLHPEDMEQTLEKIQTHLQRKTNNYIAEYRLRCKDGSYKWILARGVAKWNENGNLDRMVGFMQDITPGKQAEAEILRLNQQLEERVQKRTTQLEKANRCKDKLIVSEQIARQEAEVAHAQIQLYKDVVENMQVGLCVWHLENPDDTNSLRLITANPAANKLLGVNITDFTNQQISKCCPETLEDSQEILAALVEVARSQEATELKEFHYRNENIQLRIFAVKIFPLPEDFVGMAFENITENKWIEKALLESTQRYRVVVNSVGEVIFQTDIDGRFVFLNNAWTNITGFTTLESFNHSFIDYIFAPEDKKKCAQLFQLLILQQKDYFSYEFRIQTKTGDFRWLEIKAKTNKNNQKNVIGICGTIDDITERKQTEAVLLGRANELAKLNSVLLITTAMLEKRNQELDQFAYVTSHDLKAPLRAIANLSEWLEEDLNDLLDEDTKHQMDLLRGRVHRMEDLINGLLQYSRVGRIKVKREEIDVGKLLDEVSEFIDKPSEFNVSVVGEMPTLIAAEKLPLEQVFTNLITNSIKHHNRPDGTVKISVEDKGKFYEFVVADDGPGIAPEYHQKVFVIFQTLEARDKTENTGIGLSIVKKIIDTQGGIIILESQVGQGTTFKFTWPK